MAPTSIGARRLCLLIAGFVALLVSTLAQAESACPNLVETTSGSVFNLAALIADAGSANAALDRVRRALSKVDAGGGCAIFRDRPACDETMTLAKKAITALESCSAPSKVSSNGVIRQALD